ncbi:LytTR family transcriptional regulator DNA-binding domain-containing protein [Solibacillus sp. FSL W7-1436]|uniref:LytTR family transcriptional regulator DNA-binding domain-containing protein n=1 Tax=Solibacillus sp. FSL W7-1436 TaxID=2921705 RepID=UPI0030FA2EFA
MKIMFEPVTEYGDILLPAFEVQVQSPSVNIYTDVTKINYIIKQLSSTSGIYVHLQESGHYERLTVEETFRFYLKLHNREDSVEALIREFGLEQLKKVRADKLTLSERRLLGFLKVYIQQNDVIVLNEPFQNLQQGERKVILHLISKLQQLGKETLILSNNLEHLIQLEGEIFRLDLEGLHTLDVKEEQTEQSTATEPVQLKIEKIPTKKNEKIILFNPPEIDYIESVEGEVFVYVAGEGYPCTLTLSELEKRLHHFGFFRCHRSYIVNLQKVREIITWTRNSYSLALQGTNKSEVPLSRTKLTELKEIVGI